VFSSNLSSSLSLSDHNVDLRSRREYESQQILRGNVVIPFLELGICLIHFFRFFFLFCFSLNNEKLKISGSPTTLWFNFEYLFQSQSQFPRRYFMGQPGFPSSFFFINSFCLFIISLIKSQDITCVWLSLCAKFCCASGSHRLRARLASDPMGWGHSCFLTQDTKKMTRQNKKP